VALRPTLAFAKKALQGFPVLEPWTLAENPPRDPVELARALVSAAVLAPSNWNSQPWSFEVDGESIRLVADARRALPVLDPARKSLMISLGAALENMLVAARSYGLRTNVSYFPRGTSNPTVAEMTWTPGDVRRDRAFFTAISDRRTNRRDYDGRGIFPQNRAQLMSQASEDLRLYWLDDRDAMRAVADVAHDAVHARVSNRRAEAEQRVWMRFGNEAERRGDGVTVDALELGGPATWLAGKYFDPDSWFLRFGAEASAKHARGAIRSSGALVLLTTDRGSENQWVVGGQAYERLALKATQLGIAHQPLNEPIDSERHRPEILRRFGASGEEPLMLVRLGHAKRPPPAARRNAGLITSFRNS